MHATPPLRPVRSTRRTTTLWALGLSIALHIALLAGFVRPPAVRAEAPPVATPAPLELRTAPPTPVPRPPAMPVETAPPSTPPSVVPRIRPAVVVTTPPVAPRVMPRAASLPLAGPSGLPRRLEPADATRPATETAGVEGAFPGGPSASGESPAPQPAASLEPAPSAEPSPTPKPACVTPDRPAHAVAVVDPELPELARSRGETGVVRVRVDLDVGGAVVGTAVDGSSGYADLDRAARTAAEQSRYAAEFQHCRSIAGSYLFVARFEE